ncbi:MAG: DinB family protein [Actinobacteria bacterium]|nr:DinB family protein [Actinomycetota bacterium]
MLATLSQTDAGGLSAGFASVYGMWDELVTRASTLDESLLHDQIDFEWSFVETLRHLIYATDCWFARVVLDDPQPFHAIALSHSEARGQDPGIDLAANPTLSEVLDTRRAQQARVRAFLETLTDADLDRQCRPTTPGNPPEESFPLGAALGVIVNEEYWHHTYATRDLDVLTRGPVLDV